MKKVYVRDLATFERKKNALISEGISHLHIISDFDKTLTKSNSMGSFTVIERSTQMSANFREVMLQKFNKYHTIEKSPAISREEKSKYMMDWTIESVQAMLDDGMNLERFTHILENQPINLRDRANDLFAHLDKYKIPLLVFSAGVGDVILHLLKKFTNGHLPNNIHLIANWLSFDNDGKFVGIKGDFIHSMNKNEHSVPRDSEYYQDVVKRKNAILLGDNVGDVHMSEGLSHDTVLKVGFLNGFNEEADKERLMEFEKHFDVVIANDESLDYVLDIVDEIIKNSS